MEYEQQAGFITGSPAPTADEKTWGMLAHLSGLVASFFWLPFLGPLLVLLIKGKESRWVEQHAKEALNFQITATAALWVSGLLMFCLVGFVLAPIVWIGALVLSIIAGLKANNGEKYNYPATVRLVK
ncbi:MAG TPA: DUF4870 domain-containing protein [Archangium sp.]|nr:DUF4870 domain-containing protein [Myxococcaceae bacterium]HZH75830.1 DUF4870 domain-containing protein [Archangium sp.]